MNINVYQRALKRVLSILPYYLRMRWASIVDTNRKSLVSVYPEHTHPADLLKNVAAIERSLEQKYESFQRIEAYASYDRENLFVYSSIDDKHALIVNLPPDIPLAPAKAIIKHVKIVLRQLLKTSYEEVIRTAELV